jgi:tetratricopeptide (TPR) repeat protein
VRLLLIALLVFTTACRERRAETSQPEDVDRNAAEPVVFVEVPSAPPRVEPEPSAPPPASAHSPNPEQREQAKRLFQDGVQLYEAGDIAGAIEKFRAAYALAPLPALLFNIARGQEQLGDIAGACSSYRAARADPQTDDAMRDTVTDRLNQLKCP